MAAKMDGSGGASRAEGRLSEDRAVEVQRYGSTTILGTVADGVCAIGTVAAIGNGAAIGSDAPCNGCTSGGSDAGCACPTSAGKVAIHRPSSLW
jgi:hypothetical protein